MTGRVQGPPRFRATWTWGLMVLVLVGALAVGASGRSGPPTDSQRVTAIAETVRCPTCAGLSAAESDAKAAQAVREEIRTRVRDGQGDDAIRSYLASRYGREILLEPEARGLAGLVWALPVAAVVAAACGLAIAFRGWRRRGGGHPPSAEDRDIVAGALGR